MKPCARIGCSNSKCACTVILQCSGLFTVDIYYNCTADPLPAPTILTVTSPSPTSMTLIWEQSETSAVAVDGYEINYQYSVLQCIGEVEGDFPAISVMLNDGSLRRYTLTNSSSTPVEEDTAFFSITLTAVNSVTRSDATEFPSSITTADAGK